MSNDKEELVLEIRRLINNYNSTYHRSWDNSSLTLGLIGFRFDQVIEQPCMLDSLCNVVQNIKHLPEGRLLDETTKHRYSTEYRKVADYKPATFNCPHCSANIIKDPLVDQYTCFNCKATVATNIITAIMENAVPENLTCPVYCNDLVIGKLKINGNLFISNNQKNDIIIKENFIIKASWPNFYLKKANNKKFFLFINDLFSNGGKMYSKGDIISEENLRFIKSNYIVLRDSHAHKYIEEIK